MGLFVSMLIKIKRGLKLGTTQKLYPRVQEIKKDVIICFYHGGMKLKQGEEIIFEKSKSRVKDLKAGGIEWVRQTEKEVAHKSQIKSV